MRRRLGRFLPMVAVALLVQVIAPIGALRFVAVAVSDPLSMASLCSGMAAAGDSRGMPTGIPQQGGDCCVACAAGIAVQPALGPTTPSVEVLQRRYHRLAWLPDAQTPSSGRAGSNTQARAPPSRG